jgi:hypothetical protein
MKTCLIHSQAMTYADPTHPSPEAEIVAQAAAELFRRQEVQQFAIFGSTVIKGVKESDVLTVRLKELGIPPDVVFVNPVADTTDAEFEMFAE